MKAKETWRQRRLRDEDVAGILYASKEGSLTQREIAAVYQITQAYVSRLVNGKASRVVKEG